MSHPLGCKTQMVQKTTIFDQHLAMSQKRYKIDKGVGTKG